MDATEGLAEALEEAVERVRRGERLEGATLARLLGDPRLEERADAALALALALAASRRLAEAAPLVRRAFELSGGSRRVLPHLLRIHQALGDLETVRAAHRRVGLRAAEAGDVSRALEDFNAWHYVDAVGRGQDRYLFDQEILGAVRRLAAPLRRPLRTAPPQGRRLRAAHLVFGATQFNSVIVRLSRLFAQHRDRARWNLAFFVPESVVQVDQSPQGAGHVAFLEAQGCLVRVAPDLEGGAADRMLWLAEAIRDFAPDVLVLNAALADFAHDFLLELRPAPAAVGLVSGPPPQFAAPGLDWGIAWTLHPLMDSPISCTHVPLEADLPDPGQVALVAREALGIPEDAVVLAAAGRHTKHLDPAHWAPILEVLRLRPGAHFLCLGADRAQLSALAPLLAPLEARIHFAPWRERYLEVLGQADLVLDTYPSGGGLVLVDAMALGRPVVAVENDYGHAFDQTDWRPAQEFLPPELVVPRGDPARWLEVVLRLVDDAAHRAAMGARCQVHVRQTMGSPERMVRRCEQVFEDVIRATAR